MEKEKQIRKLAKANPKIATVNVVVIIAIYFIVN